MNLPHDTDYELNYEAHCGVNVLKITKTSIVGDIYVFFVNRPEIENVLGNCDSKLAAIDYFKKMNKLIVTDKKTGRKFEGAFVYALEKVQSDPPIIFSNFLGIDLQGCLFLGFIDELKTQFTCFRPKKDETDPSQPAVTVRPDMLYYRSDGTLTVKKQFHKNLADLTKEDLTGDSVLKGTQISIGVSLRNQADVLIWSNSKVNLSAGFYYAEFIVGPKYYMYTNMKNISTIYMSEFLNDRECSARKFNIESPQYSITMNSPATVGSYIRKLVLNITLKNEPSLWNVLQENSFILKTTVDCCVYVYVQSVALSNKPEDTPNFKEILGYFGEHGYMLVLDDKKTRGTHSYLLRTNKLSFVKDTSKMNGYKYGLNFQTGTSSSTYFLREESDEWRWLDEKTNSHKSLEKYREEAKDSDVKCLDFIGQQRLKSPCALVSCPQHAEEYHDLLLGGVQYHKKVEKRLEILRADGKRKLTVVCCLPNCIYKNLQIIDTLENYGEHFFTDGGEMKILVKDVVNNPLTESPETEMPVPSTVDIKTSQINNCADVEQGSGDPFRTYMKRYGDVLRSTLSDERKKETKSDSEFQHCAEYVNKALGSKTRRNLMQEFVGHVFRPEGKMKKCLLFASTGSGKGETICNAIVRFYKHRQENDDPGYDSILVIVPSYELRLNLLKELMLRDPEFMRENGVFIEYGETRKLVRMGDFDLLTTAFRHGNSRLKSTPSVSIAIHADFVTNAKSKEEGGKSCSATLLPFMDRSRDLNLHRTVVLVDEIHQIVEKKGDDDKWSEYSVSEYMLSGIRSAPYIYGVTATPFATSDEELNQNEATDFAEKMNTLYSRVFNKTGEEKLLSPIDYTIIGEASGVYVKPFEIEFDFIDTSLSAAEMTEFSGFCEQRSTLDKRYLQMLDGLLSSEYMIEIDPTFDGHMLTLGSYMRKMFYSSSKPGSLFGDLANNTLAVRLSKTENETKYNPSDHKIGENIYIKCAEHIRSFSSVVSRYVIFSRYCTGFSEVCAAAINRKNKDSAHMNIVVIDGQRGPSFVVGNSKFSEDMSDLSVRQQGDTVLSWCNKESSGSWLLICNTKNYSTGVSIPGVHGSMYITPVSTTSEYMQLWGRVNRFCYDVDNSKHYRIKQLFVKYGDQDEFTNKKVNALKNLVEMYNNLNKGQFIMSMSGITNPYKLKTPVE